MRQQIQRILGSVGFRSKPKTRVRKRYRHEFFYTIEERHKLARRPIGAPFLKKVYTVSRCAAGVPGEDSVSFIQVLDAKDHILETPTDEDIMHYADVLIDQEKRKTKS